MAFGLLPTGFVPKTLSDIKAEQEADYKAGFGASIDLAPEGPFGQLIGIGSFYVAEVWDATQALYSADDPDGATGTRLVQLCAITGTLPLPATSSSVIETLVGTNGTIIPLGSTVSVVVTNLRFDTDTAATIVALASWAAAHLYAVGDLITNGGNVYYCITAGTSAGGVFSPTTSSDITDNTVHWTYAGAGTAAVNVTASCEVTGPVPALAGTLSQIETPVSGWTSAVNIHDATPGRAKETDAELRARRELELRGDSGGTVDGIRTRVLEDLAAEGVTVCIVFENTSNVTDGDGMPPHSVEVLVIGGVAQDITDEVFKVVDAGTTTHGTQTGTHVDAANGGQTYTVKWSRPANKNIYVIANVVKDPGTFPSDGSAQLLTAILAVGASYVPGKDCVSSQLVAACFKVAGVLEVSSLYIGTAPAPASTATVTVALREIAVLDSSRATINLSDGTP